MLSELLAVGVRTSHPNGHFYSPVCDPADLKQRAAEIWPDPPSACLGIDFNDASHLEILRQWFPRHIKDFDYPEHGAADTELSHFYIQNSQFSWLDARALFVILRELQPRRVIEVGSGYSSLLMADVNRRFLGSRSRIRCIEPYPREFLKRGVAGIDAVLVQRVQDVPLSVFAELEAGDVLFIDSSHVSKTGSDVNYLYFEVLPRLACGVVVHIHDIFLPHDYPRDWVIDENRSWNEQYVLRALLMHSSAFRTLFGCSYAWWRFPQEVIASLGFHDRRGFAGASYWMRRI